MERVSLNGHISSRDAFNPFDEGRIEVWAGAGLIKVIKQGRHKIIPENDPNQKKRVQIHGFSRASRRRMMQLLVKVRLDEALPLFDTTTYLDIPRNIPQDDSSEFRHQDFNHDS